MDLTLTRLNQQYIGGQWRDGSSERRLSVRNPFDNAEIGVFTIASKADIDEAYLAARAAQPAWEAMSAYQRRTVFENAAAIVERRRDEITALIIREVGGTALKAAFEIGLVIDAIKEAGTTGFRIQGSIIPSPVPNTENYVYRKALGVVGVISPFNFPFFLGLKPVVAALSTGNGVVLKPHEATPITGGTLMAEIFEEAGLPAGLFNVTVTEIPEIGDYFLEHPVPRAIVFTGSAPVGRHVGEVCARHFKKAILELGGNSAFIVLEDADIDYAVESATFSRFTHQGQICMSANRVLVHSSVAAEFREKFARKVSGLRTGDPADPATIVGPLINRREVENLERTVDEAIAAGANALVRQGSRGNVLGPVVLDNVKSSDAVAQGELFGPVILIMEFADDDQAITIANDTEYGLSGAIHTKDLARGVRLAKRIETGMVHINDSTISDEPIVPFGGEKNSGIGRLSGQATIDELTTQQWISVNHGQSRYPY
ncbi:MAG: aldehyde dehydrogenase family protein [Microbacterium sp.]|uniref:aldehyde dehydrogenase family protein n=1 Tax=Microbacterium sp. TaxID=51671 RepID=UPI001E10C0E7|nr:aldehyde dehydrogenase family protein [Microbacterium sp.]MBW8763270.1 aldehyde dehydrogenase family protein [Microbacterium sp.]